jgi:hypothetical protein
LFVHVAPMALANAWHLTSCFTGFRISSRVKWDAWISSKHVSRRRRQVHTTLTSVILRSRPGTTSEWIKLSSYTCITCLSTLQCNGWSSLLHKTMEIMEVGWACWIWVTNGYNPYYYDMVEARNHFRLDYTFILYRYKVFKHLPMQ